MMALAFFVQTIVNNLTSLHLGADVTVAVGLVLGEVSKYINNRLSY